MDALRCYNMDKMFAPARNERTEINSRGGTFFKSSFLVVVSSTQFIIRHIVEFNDKMFNKQDENLMK